MRRLSLLLTAMLMAVCVYSQKTKTVTAEYTYYAPETMSVEEAKRTALDRAKIQAIADAFGTVVTQTNSTSIETANGSTSTTFRSDGGSEVKGEWIETIGEPEFKINTDGNAIAINVSVKGKIREITAMKVPIDVKTFRNGISDMNESIEFLSGDSFYMSFNAPASGFLAVYLIDAEDNAFCLLPYRGQTNGIYSTMANHRYLLFNKEAADKSEKNIVDEFVLDTSLEKEQNRILTIFSPNKFFKAVDQSANIELPRSLRYSDFATWLDKIRRADTQLAVNETVITIKSKKSLTDK